MPNPQTFGSNSFKDDGTILLFVGELTISINRTILPLVIMQFKEYIFFKNPLIILILKFNFSWLLEVLIFEDFMNCTHKIFQ
jgi:hypothetical protein